MTRTMHAGAAIAALLIAGLVGFGTPASAADNDHRWGGSGAHHADQGSRHDVDWRHGRDHHDRNGGHDRWGRGHDFGRHGFHGGPHHGSWRPGPGHGGPHFGHGFGRR